MIPTIDLSSWRASAAAVDEAQQKAGFLLVTGHGVDDALRAEVRDAARRFFALPVEVKQRYAVPIGGRGRLAPGVEANGNADAFGAGAGNVEGGDHPPGLKESFPVGPVTPTGDAAVDDVWFPPNVWPVEVPELRSAVERHLAAMTALSRDLLKLSAGALGLPPDTPGRHLAALSSPPIRQRDRPTPITRPVATTHLPGRRSLIGPLIHRAL